MIYQGISVHARVRVTWNRFIIVPVWTRENGLKPAPPETGTNRFVV